MRKPQPSTVAHPRGDRALLTDLLVSQDVAILGAAVLASEGLRLPLLPKFLDVSGLLSVQAHPPGNPELYVVLEADAEAALYLGFKAQLDPTPWQNRWTDALGTCRPGGGPRRRPGLADAGLGDDRCGPCPHLGHPLRPSGFKRYAGALESPVSYGGT